jgi:hypothetical protein
MMAPVLGASGVWLGLAPGAAQPDQLDQAARVAGSQLERLGSRRPVRPVDLTQEGFPFGVVQVVAARFG